MLKIGIVGLGGMGTVHYSNYQHIDGVKVVAVTDPNLSEAKANELGIKVYDDIATMIQSEALDVVDVCTPTFLHKSAVMEALHQKVHVICEKPLALSKADAQEMIDLAKAQGVKLFVGQVLQYARETLVLKEIIESNKYGKVLDAQFLRLSAMPRWIKNGWLFDKDKSGLLPFDLHIHDLDLIISLFGAPKDVSFTSAGRDEVSYKEHYRFTYTYEDKTISAEAAWYNADFPFTATWRIYFENAVVTHDEKGLVAYQFDHEPKVYDTTELIQIPTGINLPPTGMFYYELSDFVNDILTKDYVGCAREAEIIKVIEILEMINRA